MSVEGAARRTLVAGVGNIFLADDGFGVEVVRRLAAVSVPQGVTVADFGIRGVHLAYEILDGGYDQVVLVDALPHGGAPGSIALLEVDRDDPGVAVTADGHDMHPAAVVAFLKSIGGIPPPITVVGCQPASLDEDMGLTDVVSASIDEAIQAVLSLVKDGGSARVSGDSGTDCRAQR
jgi:hydrogenase maturation protease